MAADPTALHQLPLGKTGTIIAINLVTDDARRIQEMGLLPGTKVELIRFAPLGDPVEIKVRGYHLSLRKHEAEQIIVVPTV